MFDFNLLPTGSHNHGKSQYGLTRMRAIRPTWLVNYDHFSTTLEQSSQTENQ